jgi:hypothetical protein
MLFDVVPNTAILAFLDTAPHGAADTKPSAFLIDTFAQKPSNKGCFK